MAEFKPFNLAEIYRNADAGIAQALQSNMMVMQSAQMKREYDEEESLRTLARTSTSTDETGQPQFDLKSFTKGAYGINPMKGLAFEKTQREAEKAALEKENLQGQVDERRFKVANDRLKVMNEASTVPYLKYKELIEGGMDDAEARKQVQPMYATAVQSLVQSGMFTREQMASMKVLQTQQFDPQVAETGMRQVLGAKEQLAEYWNKKNYGQRERFHEDTIQIQQDGQDITLRGQDLAQYEVDRDRGIVVNKSTGKSFPIVTAGGTGLPAKGSDVEGLRKEFNNREEVKNYNAAVPVLRAVAKAPDTGAGDLDFIYGVGKILDPGSVVREGEMNLVIKSGTVMEQLLGASRFNAGAGGRLTPGQRQKFLEALDNRVGELHTAATDARKPFETQAKRQNIPLEETLTLPDRPKFGKGKADAPQAPAVGHVEEGFRFKGGDPSKPESWEKVS